MNIYRMLRKAKKLSQKELGKLVHVSQTSVSQWESGTTNPDIKTLVMLAELYGVTTDFLLGRLEMEDNAQSGFSYERVTDLEKRVIEGFRQLSLTERELICRAIGIE